MKITLIIILSYLVGAIPSAYIVGRLRGLDIRKYGSGNVGATNAYRTLGKTLGFVVLGFDIFKGVCATYLVPLLISNGDVNINLLAGAFSVIGHNWPVYLRFKGGKGIAVSLGVIIGLCFVVPALIMIIGLCLVVWLCVFFLSGFVSLASIASASLLLVVSPFFFDSMSVKIFFVALSALAIFKHKSNIMRLLSNKESRVDLPWLKR